MVVVVVVIILVVAVSLREPARRSLMWSTLCPRLWPMWGKCRGDVNASTGQVSYATLSIDCGIIVYFHSHLCSHFDLTFTFTLSLG